MSILILLATCNGAPYLRQFLGSLERQTLTDWQLLVRDDASSDGTPDMLAHAAARDQRILVLNDPLGRLGPAGNFGALMRAAVDRDARFAAFADQDDVWMPDKLSRHLALLRECEREEGRELAVLVHSDLAVVDELLVTRHASFMRWSGLPHGDRASLENLLVRNHVVGCTMLANRRLLELAVPVPEDMVMHDWWLGLLAASCGRLVYDDTPTVLYRQHATNQIGAASPARKLAAALRNWRPKWRQALGNFARGVRQAHALRDRLGRIDKRPAGAPSAAMALVDDYCQLFDSAHSRVARLSKMRRLGIQPAGLLPHAAVYARALALPAAARPHAPSDSPLRPASPRTQRQQGPS